ncbi:hypothetical protein AUJ84_01105 [Candidatus Pacearchaeota archaeon CG1_02_32_132]|nr:MAG: hypothetical protein AUJ84_01105 [Candidatus Pacearchaeota archaeon CG1_02_32_132]
MNFKSISCDEFEKLMGEGFVIKAPIEYPEEIEGTDLIIKLGENLDDYRAKLPGKNNKLLVYCYRGFISKHISEQLAKLGYKVYDLGGGMKSWEGSGRELK